MLQPLRLGSITARILAALLWCGIGQPVDLPLRDLRAQVSGRRGVTPRRCSEARREAWVAPMPGGEIPRRPGKGAAAEDGPPSWIRLWARARYELGLTGQEWCWE